VPGSSASPRRHGIWTTRRAVLCSAALVVWIPGCAVATWWQVGVGRSGDDLGWVYSVMWPCFAVFGTVFWWFLVHDDPESLGRRGLQRLQRASATTSNAGGITGVEGAGSSGNGRAGAVGEAAHGDAIRRAEESDPELAAYNEYLAALRDQPSTWRRR